MVYDDVSGVSYRFGHVTDRGAVAIICGGGLPAEGNHTATRAARFHDNDFAATGGVAGVIISGEGAIGV